MNDKELLAKASEWVSLNRPNKGIYDAMVDAYVAGVKASRPEPHGTKMKIAAPLFLSQLFAPAPVPLMAITDVEFDCWSDVITLRVAGPDVPAGADEVLAEIHTKTAHVELKPYPVAARATHVKTLHLSGGKGETCKHCGVSLAKGQREGFWNTNARTEDASLYATPPAGYEVCTTGAEYWRTPIKGGA